MLIDVHAHFYHDRTPRADWRERNASRLRAGERMGVTIHVASVLGTWGRTSPVYFPSPPDLQYGNDALLALERAHADRIRGYVTVNPNFTAHALGEIDRCRAAGMIGIKLAASRRANDPLLDPICELARERGLPVLHQVWQHSLAALRGGTPNVLLDLSGSGADGGMLESCVEAVGVERLLWGSDLTMDTGWAKLRYLAHLLRGPELEQVSWKNAARIFPRG